MDESKIKKCVVLIEDKLSEVEGMLQSVQTYLTIAAKRNMVNAPENEDTLIFVLLALKEDKSQESGRLEQIIRSVQTWQEQLFEEQAVIFQYAHEIWELNENDYDQNYETIAKLIDNKCNGKAYSIMLDVVLNEKKDMEDVLGGKEILSQKIYKKYKEKCIPYTRYDDYAEQFRQKWKDAVGREKLPYERFRIMGGNIYKPMQEELYQHLEITGG